MIQYIVAFIFYTLAMIGIIFAGFIVYKKTMMSDSLKDRKGTMRIVDSLPIGNKKQLLVLKVQNKKFLIASGLEHTTFLADLTPCASIKQPSQLQVQIQNPEQSDSIKETRKMREEEKLPVSKIPFNKNNNHQELARNMQDISLNDSLNGNRFDEERFSDDKFNEDDFDSKFVKFYGNKNNKKDSLRRLLENLNENKINSGSRF